MERWLPVPGYDGAYWVSDRGQVISTKRRDERGRLRRERMMNPARQRTGHLTVGLRRSGASRQFQVSNLVLMAFVGSCPDGMEACHWNDDPSDNCLENLRWDTRSANQLDSVRNGTHHMARRTHCPQGHPYTPENTYRKPAGNRCCNECRRIYRETHVEERRIKGREYMRRKRAAARSATTRKTAA